MGSVVAGVAGAAVGSAFGMPGLGYTIGSSLYGAFNKPDPVRQSQPLIDLKVPGTEYGQPLPYIRGSMRLAPQYWWNTDRIPLTTEEESEAPGKGPSAPSTVTETTTYSMDAFWGLTQNQILGVARIWDSGDLIWNTTEGVSGGTIVASNTSEHWTRMTIYTGSATQEPDPDYETAIDSEVAPDSAPAYRIRGSAFVKGLQLGQSGQLRNFTFEVVVDGTQGPSIEYYDGTATAGDAMSIIRFIDTLNELWMPDQNFANSPSPDRIAIKLLATDTWEYITLPAPLQQTLNIGVLLIARPELDVIYVQTRDHVTSGEPRGTLIYQLSTRQLLADTVDLFGGTNDNVIYGVDSVNERCIAQVDGNIVIYATAGGVPTSAVSEAMAPTNLVEGEILADADGAFWSFNSSDQISTFSTTTGRTDINTGADGCVRVAFGHVYDPTRNCMFFWSNTGGGEYLKKIDCDTNVITRVNSVAYATSGSFPSDGTLMYAEDLDRVIAIHGVVGMSMDIFIIDPDDGSIETTYSIPDPGGTRFIAGTEYAPGVIWGVSGTWDGGAEKGYGEFRFNTISKNCPTVAQVESGICLRAGLTASQIDVTPLSSITKLVCCMPWSQVTPAREPTERLEGCYFFETTMSGGQIKFVPRGGSTIATIPYEDLNASINGSDSDPFPLRKSNDLELPAFKSITYINLSNDYQNDTQMSDRLLSATSTSIEATDIQLGMTPSEAKAVADTHSLDQAASVAGATIRIMRLDYPELEPTDPIMVTAADGSLIRMRIVEMTDEFPFATLRLVIDDTSVLTSQGITSVDYDSSSEISSPTSTVFQLLDIPILRDEDDDAGKYVVAKGSSSPWPGAAIYESPDNVEYSRVATIIQSGVFGNQVNTVLGDWTGPRVFDEVNTVTVNVGNGTLTSSTRATVLGSLAVNAMLIGSEIIQFINATLVSPGVYTLSRLLRGHRGTEWAMIDHAAGERCVLLRSAGIRRIAGTTAQVGVERFDKGVTLGRSIGTATARRFTNMAIGQKPFSPVRLRISRDVSNNATLEVERRSRFSCRLVGTLGVSIPLSDLDEYEWDIYSDGTYTTVVDTLLSTGPSVAYSAADQTADGLTPGNDLFVDVFQMSDVVGRGYALRGAQ